MRFLVDESTGPAVAPWLRGQGHTVFSVYDEARGIDDEAVAIRVVQTKTSVLNKGRSFYSLLITHRPRARFCDHYHGR